MFLRIMVCLAFQLCGYLVVLGAESWPQFRGGPGNGVVKGANLPLEWSADKNVAWKTELPGIGWASPVLAGDRVFVTTAITDKKQVASGFTAGVADPRFMLPFGSPKPPDVEYRWEVICLDRQTGKQLWRKECARQKPPIPVHSSNTYATETPVTDGERVAAYFGPIGLVVCLDREGKELWRKDLGAAPFATGFGSGGSPCLMSGKLYVQRDTEKKSALYAYELATGKELWKVDRDGKTSWSTPVVWKNRVRTDLIVCGSGKVVGYDPATGKEVWRMTGIPATFTASPTFDEERLYFGTSSPMTPGMLYTVRAGATGDVTPAKGETTSKWVAWSSKGTGPGISSPVVHEGRLFLVGSGFVTCFDAKTGEKVYRARINQARNVSSSPLVIDGKLYLLDEDGQTIIAGTGSTFEVLGRNKVEGLFWSTPAVLDGALYLRAADRLYCIRK